MSVSLSTWGVVVAGGRGTRFGGPKQFEKLGSRRIVDWSVEAARCTCRGVVLVLPEGDRSGSSAAIGPSDAADADFVVEGGGTRSASVRAGLAAVPAEADVIVIHDAARPLASESLFREVISAVTSGDASDGAVPVLPLGDTVKRVEDDRVIETLERRGLVVVQTPQAFRSPALRRAHRGEPAATDDASLVEAVGGTVAAVPGDPRNIKVTDRTDLAICRALLSS